MLLLRARRKRKLASRCPAREVESVWLSELAKGEVGIFKPPTLEGFSERFINYLPGRVAKRTFRFYVDGWNALTHLESPLYNVRLNQIDSAKIEAYIAWRQNRLQSTCDGSQQEGHHVLVRGTCTTGTRLRPPARAARPWVGIAFG